LGKADGRQRGENQGEKEKERWSERLREIAKHRTYLIDCRRSHRWNRLPAVEPPLEDQTFSRNAAPTDPISRSIVDLARVAKCADGTWPAPRRRYPRRTSPISSRQLSLRLRKESAVDTQVRATIGSHLDHLRTLERQSIDTLSCQIDAFRKQNQPDTLVLLEDFRQTLENHLRALDHRSSAFRAAAPSQAAPTAGGAVGIATCLTSPNQTDAASAVLRNDYALLSLDAITYLTLHTTALSLGDNETAALAERGYRDCARMVVAIDRLIPDVVIAELRQEGLTPRDVAAECRRLVASSWQRQPHGRAGQQAA
jgi:hypothetical protein